MSRKLNLAAIVSLAATVSFALFSSQGSFAAVKARGPHEAVIAQVAPAGDLTLPHVSTALVKAAEPQAESAPSAASLTELVARKTAAAPLSTELNCLANAIYFESKSEPLAGQLAVGRVIVARANSGRFPSSYCGVVYQPSQFSFVRGRTLPAVNRDSAGWKNAVAIARIADEGSWSSPVEGALYFHASRVSTRWGKARIAQVGNHVFYR